MQWQLPTQMVLGMDGCLLHLNIPPRSLCTHSPSAIEDAAEFGAQVLFSTLLRRQCTSRRLDCSIVNSDQRCIPSTAHIRRVSMQLRYPRRRSKVVMRGYVQELQIDPIRQLSIDGERSNSKRSVSTAGVTSGPDIPGAHMDETVKPKPNPIHRKIA